MTTRAGWLATTPAPRDRVLTDNENRLLWNETNGTVRLLRFLLLAELRISEARKGQQNGDKRGVPADVSRNGRQHRVYPGRIKTAKILEQTLLAGYMKNLCRPEAVISGEQEKPRAGRGLSVGMQRLMPCVAVSSPLPRQGQCRAARVCRVRAHSPPPYQ